MRSYRRALKEFEGNQANVDLPTTTSEDALIRALNNPFAAPLSAPTADEKNQKETLKAPMHRAEREKLAAEQRRKNYEEKQAEKERLRLEKEKALKESKEKRQKEFRKHQRRTKKGQMKLSVLSSKMLNALSSSR